MRKQPSLARNGVIGTVLILLTVAVIVGHRSIPLVGSNGTYHAMFTDASALDVGDDVQLAGTVIGEVTEVTLDGPRVRVSFALADHSELIGARTRAAVKVGTVLGQRYLELTPDGDCCLKVGDTIPQSRTVSGFDITDSLGDLAATAGDTDVSDLVAALHTTGDVADAATPNLRSALVGLQRLSESITGRDTELVNLLKHSNNLTEILSRRNVQILSLFTDGRTLLAELNARSSAIHDVLVEGRRVASQLTALSTENEKTLGPSLRELSATLALLNKNYSNINQAISGLSNFATQLDDIVANGPFFSALIHNVLPADLHGQRPYSPGAPR